jgi:hypothetical protein
MFGVKGTLINSYGIYADEASAALVEKLPKAPTLKGGERWLLKN